MEPITSTSTPQSSKPKSHTTKIVLIVIAILIIIGAVWGVKRMNAAASVNGMTISRSEVTETLEKQGGKGVLDGLITEKLVEAEIKERGVVVTDEEVSQEIAKVEKAITAQGGTLDIALTQQGVTLEEFKDRVRTQKAVQKLMADKTQVSDEEVNKYITDAKITIPKGQEVTMKAQVKEQLQSQKFSEAAQAWITGLRSSANIKYYKNY